MNLTNEILPQNWQDNIRGAIKDSKTLSEFLMIPVPEVIYPVFIPHALAALIKSHGPHHPLFKQYVPTQFENSEDGLVDPIGDQIHAKEKGIIHRYENRVLFTPTTTCPVQCRYCFRKNELHDNQDFLKGSLEHLENYLKEHPFVNEVIMTGGDPLMLSNKKLASYVDMLLKIPSVHFIRFHTRMPVVVPARVDDEFIAILQKIADDKKTPIIVLHINHASEMELEYFKESMAKLKTVPITLLAQSVLLKNVNDNVQTLTELFLKLNHHGIRPYYLHHPDQVKGGMHFYLERHIGHKLMQEVRQKVPGWLLPHYILDNPDGTGKTSAYLS